MLLEAWSAEHTAHTGSSAPDEGEELFPRLGIFSEHTQHRAGHSLAVHFLHPSHYHTHVSTKQANKGRTNSYWFGFKIKNRPKY